MNHQERLDNLRSRLIVGTQYYRPPTPLPEDWEDDFKRMRDLGLTMIKFWVYWRWIEYRQGRLEFSDYDRLFELGAQYGIRMQPNLFVESAPQWVFDKYPDCLPVTIKREKMPPHERSSTQIGGYMPCFDHDAVRKLAMEFIGRVVTRYKAHPALACWDIWNEISLKIGGDVCACPASTARYQRWLEQSYGDIAALNRTWNMRYAAFADVTPPVNQMNYASYMHWRVFSAEHVAWHGAWRSQAIRDAAPDQVVMVHFGGSPVWVARTGNLPTMRATKAIVDFLGVSGHNPPRMRHSDHFKNNAALDANYAFLCSLEDYPWASEVSSDITVMSERYPAPPASKEFIAYGTLLPIAMGCKAVLYWSFKPERFGNETPGIGLVKHDGSYPSRAHEVKRIAAFLESEPEFFAGAKPPPAAIGILHDDESALLTSLVYESPFHPQNKQAYVESLRGAYHTCQLLQQPAHFLYPESVPQSRAQIIYIPMMALARQSWLKPLRQFVENGGTLIAEGGLGQYRENDYFYEKIIPGSGLHELFGVKEIGAIHEVYLSGNAPSEKPSAAIPAGMHGDVLETGGAGSSSGIGREFLIRWDGGEFLGHFEKRPLQLLDAQPLAWFQDGSIAASVRPLGRGRAIYIGTSPALGVWRTQSNYPAFLRSLIALASPYEELFAAIPEQVTLASLTHAGRSMYFVFNQGGAPAELRLKRPAILKYAVNPETDVLAGETLRVSPYSTMILEA